MLLELTVTNLTRSMLIIVCSLIDCHQLLDFNSAHPIYIKKSIVYSQGIKRLSSSSLAFEKHLQSIRSSFGKCDYRKKLVENHLRRLVVVENRPKQLSENQTKHRTGVSLVVTYHLWFHDFGRIIRKNFIYLYA